MNYNSTPNERMGNTIHEGIVVEAYICKPEEDNCVFIDSNLGTHKGSKRIKQVPLTSLELLKEWCIKYFEEDDCFVLEIPGIISMGISSVCFENTNGNVSFTLIDGSTVTGTPEFFFKNCSVKVNGKRIRIGVAK